MAANSNDSLQLTSPAFADGQPIPVKYTCKGENINPPLRIQGVPNGTASLVLIMHDPDAIGGDWVHWLVWNIDPATKEIPEGSVPSGAVEGTTSFGKVGYDGPCPPPGTGTHRYIFELFALDVVPDLPMSTRRERLLRAMQGHILDQAKLTGLFSAE